ncbi:MAG: type II secretion system protein [Candidatus Gracilibacteria bacterium]|jgi:prepilin-type N-terminal cleavage/methylation domain-containing protein
MKRLILIGTKNNGSEKVRAGFTLVELLIVLTIVAVLAVATVLILNPAEILKKSRDTQRMSDLASIKSAIALYLSTVSTPYVGGAADDLYCLDKASESIAVSYPSDTADFIDTTTATGWGGAAATWIQTTAAGAGDVDGTGWIPVKISDTTGGAAISNFPIDPNHSPAADVDGINELTNADRYYRYVCRDAAATPPSTFEIDANLESSYYTSGTTNAEANDGGNNASLYETGTDLTILPNEDTY